MVQALWDMSNGKFNYSEFTADEFKLLKDCGDAENGVEQGNSEVSKSFRLCPGGPSHCGGKYAILYTIALTPM